MRVHPTFIPSSHPLASVNDAYNAVYLCGDALDDIMLYGKGAGSFPTASAVVSDVIYAATHLEIKYSTYKNTATPDGSVKFISDFSSSYYVRLFVDDVIGVLAKTCGVFGKCGVSIERIMQLGAKNMETGRMPVVIITHDTKENSVKKAVAQINAAGFGTVEAVIRVEK